VSTGRPGGDGPDDQGMPRDGYYVRAVVRATEILELIRTSDGGASISELTGGSGLAKASVFRMLRTLEGTGLVERIPGTDLYRLGVRCLEFGQGYLEQVDLRQDALPVMEGLRSRFNETVHLGVLDDQLRLVYLEKLETTHAVGLMMSRVGRTAPSFCTGLGKALLAGQADDVVDALSDSGQLRRYTDATICEPAPLRAELGRIRERGYSLDLEEHERGVRCVAAAIGGPDGRPVAAISIAGPAERLPERQLRGELARAVTAAVREVSHRLGAAREKAE
jgi:DNA-binding IclR family transcriptional regulator